MVTRCIFVSWCFAPISLLYVTGAVKGPDAPDVKVEGGSLTGKLTAGAASVGAAALGAIGLYGRSGKADVEVCQEFPMVLDDFPCFLGALRDGM